MKIQKLDRQEAVISKQESSKECLRYWAEIEVRKKHDITKGLINLVILPRDAKIVLSRGDSIEGQTSVWEIINQEVDVHVKRR